MVFEALQFFFFLKVNFNTVGEALVLLFSCSVMSNSLQPRGLQHDRLRFPVLHCLLEIAQTLAHWVDDAIHSLTLCHPLLLLSSIFPSIRVFSSVLSCLIRWPKYWSFSFSINLSSEYSRLISFRMNWLDLLAVQGTLKTPKQHSSKASSF